MGEFPGSSSGDRFVPVPSGLHAFGLLPGGGIPTIKTLTPAMILFFRRTSRTPE
ncbi:hypothetical protein BV22DRAFT_1030561 [Leucogyrophana mollusca]|uniref:Uncharacterized protein n=1 Tax=Leucogyrophana mollusca TaxID=85980 RepID=A0ACB8BVH3_9AGAM|nr:hypothetical protein BV22DRAFT_1030561 [Leucogyrophana mollusca]